MYSSNAPEKRKEYGERWKKDNPEKYLECCRKGSKKYYTTHTDELLKRDRDRRDARKVLVLTHYGNGKLKCILCPEDRLACLSIDHINGSGSKHRAEIGMNGGKKFYKWLVDQDFPKGFRTLCMNCQFVEREKFYRR